LQKSAKRWTAQLPSNIQVFRAKTDTEIQLMFEAGEILGACLKHLCEMVRPGVTTEVINQEADQFIRGHGCAPGFLGYQGFPKSICISVNQEVVHGIPGPRRIEEGDLVSLDLGLVRLGWWADSGCSVGCGPIDAEAQRLIDVTRESLQRAIAVCLPGKTIGDIGHAVQSYVEANGFSVVRQYVGHGIGQEMHEPPQVPNFGQPGTGNQLKVGHVLAIEPMVNAGGPGVHVLADDWTVVTDDGKRSCYFEHTVAVTEDGPKVLTAWPD
jgi:methionyl aminopeptidase